jgi:hypothetical protein
VIRELRSTFERVHLPRRSEVDAAAGVLVAERQLEARKVDTEQAGVVDSGGTRTAEEPAPRVPGDKPPVMRSDLTEMHPRIYAINAPRLAPTGNGVDGRSVPWTR